MAHGRCSVETGQISEVIPLNSTSLQSRGLEIWGSMKYKTQKKILLLLNFGIQQFSKHLQGSLVYFKHLLQAVDAMC